MNYDDLAATEDRYAEARTLRPIPWGKKDQTLARALALQFDHNWLSTLAPWEKESVAREARQLRQRHQINVWPWILGLMVLGVVLFGMMLTQRQAKAEPVIANLEQAG